MEVKTFNFIMNDIADLRDNESRFHEEEAYVSITHNGGKKSTISVKDILSTPADTPIIVHRNKFQDGADTVRSYLTLGDIETIEITFPTIYEASIAKRNIDKSLPF